MICTGLNVRLQRHIKVFPYILAFQGGGGESLLSLLHYIYIELNTMKSHKGFLIHYGLYFETVGVF